SAQFFPDGRRVLVCGHEEGHAVRCYSQEIAAGKPHPLTREGTSWGFVSPDGRSVLVAGSAGDLLLYPAEGGQARAVNGAAPGDEVIEWPADGRFVLVRRTSEVPTRIERLDLSTGKRDQVMTLGPTDLTGVLEIGAVVLSEDGKCHAYSYRRSVSHLFLVTGAR
ncbi:MAG: hypothetical protein ACRD1P_13570, partial [Thermoanaerobaculia bacterium]